MSKKKKLKVTTSTQDDAKDAWIGIAVIFVLFLIVMSLRYAVEIKEKVDMVDACLDLSKYDRSANVGRYQGTFYCSTDKRMYTDVEKITKAIELAKAGCGI